MNQMNNSRGMAAGKKNLFEVTPTLRHPLGEKPLTSGDMSVDF